MTQLYNFFVECHMLKYVGRKNTRFLFKISIEKFRICRDRPHVAGDGLMVHAEQFRLRTNSDAGGDCHDYIGFQLHISSTSFFYDITQFSTQDLVSRSTSF